MNVLSTPIPMHLDDGSDDGAGKPYVWENVELVALDMRRWDTTEERMALVVRPGKRLAVVALGRLRAR